MFPAKILATVKAMETSDGDEDSRSQNALLKTFSTVLPGYSLSA